MPTTITFLDAAGADLEVATFRATPPCAAVEWATRIVAMAAGVDGAMIKGWRIGGQS